MNTSLPNLNPRLFKIASLLKPCRCLADIGTDHGYIPIFALFNGICRRAIASDINPGPLDRAREHAQQMCLEDKIGLRLGGGLSTLQAGEADTIVIAGMGGLLIAEILENSPEIVKGAHRLILQPMTAQTELRQYLARGGYTLDKEYLVAEDEKIYNIFDVYVGGETHYTPKELLLGKSVEADAHLARLHFEKIERKLRIRLEGLENSALEESKSKAEEVRQLLGIINS